TFMHFGKAIYMLIHIPDVLTKQQVQEFRRELAAAEWVDGRATVGYQGAQVRQKRQLPVDNPTGLPLGEIIFTPLYRNSLFLSAALPLRSVPPLFNSYQGGEHYGWHIDGAVRRLPGSDVNLRTDLSSTLFLSEPEEYEGGELIVHDTYGTHEVKLPAG